LEGKIRGKIEFLGVKKIHGRWGKKSSLVIVIFALSP
jgi:hypothetical protein